MENPLDDKSIQTIKDLAAVGYSITEIAEVAEINLDEFMRLIEIKEHPVARAYLAGKNELKFATRKSIVDLASNGSMPAALKALEFLQNQETDERYH